MCNKMASPITVHVIFFCFMTLIYRFFPGGFENNFKYIDGNKKAPASWVDIIYYNAAVYSTVGYGDVTPITPLAKMAAIFQMIVVFSLVVLGIKI